jgi:hypothetical protein
MSDIVEKRTVKILPSVIDKKLIQELGELLENQRLCRDRVNYFLNGKTKNVQSTKVKDFIKADWGPAINQITVETKALTSDYGSEKYRDVPQIEIDINFRNPNESDFTVSSRDAVWVNGITEQINAIFEKYRQSFCKIKTSWFIRLPLTLPLSLVFVYPILLALGSFVKPEKLVDFYVTMGTLLVMFFGMGLSWLIGWLFPYLEYGVTKQKRMRNWIWILLFGSGIIPAIILKLLGF